MSDILKLGFMSIHILLVNPTKFTDHDSENFQWLTCNLPKLISFTKSYKMLSGNENNNNISIFIILIIIKITKTVKMKRNQF